MTNCVVCNNKLTGRQTKYCSRPCGYSNHEYAEKFKRRQEQARRDGLSEKIKQEYGNLRVYGI